MINRGMSLHKMIRMITFALGGEVIELHEGFFSLVELSYIGLGLLEFHGKRVRTS